MSNFPQQNQIAPPHSQALLANMATSVDARLLKQTRFPPEFSQKVDMKKVNVEVMKKYFLPEFQERLSLS